MNVYSDIVFKKLVLSAKLDFSLKELHSSGTFLAGRLFRNEMVCRM